MRVAVECGAYATGQLPSSDVAHTSELHRTPLSLYVIVGQTRPPTLFLGGRSQNIRKRSATDGHASRKCAGMQASPLKLWEMHSMVSKRCCAYSCGHPRSSMVHVRRPAFLTTSVASERCDTRPCRAKQRLSIAEVHARACLCPMRRPPHRRMQMFHMTWSVDRTRSCACFDTASYTAGIATDVFQWGFDCAVKT